MPIFYHTLGILLMITDSTICNFYVKEYQKPISITLILVLTAGPIEECISHGIP